jgi:hypothetical protein
MGNRVKAESEPIAVSSAVSGGLFRLSESLSLGWEGREKGEQASRAAWEVSVFYGK